MTPILIGRQPSLKLLDYLRDHPDQTFAVFAQKDASVDYPIQEDLFEVGVYAKLVKEFEVPGSNNEHSAIVIASARCRLKSLDDANNFFTAETEMIPEVFPAEDDKEFAAAVEGLRQGVEIYVKMNDDIPNEAMVALQNISNHLSIVNFVASNIVSNIYDKIMLLEEDNMKLRLFKLLKVLNRETQFLHIKKNIQNKTRADIDEQQKEYFLHQQIKNIREELGDSGESEDKRELKKKAFLKPWPDEVSKLFAKELAKLDNINPQSPDYSVLLNYLQTLVSLPWGVYTKDRLDLKRAQRVLDRNHYGMEKVKERILEYMAVLRLRGDLKSPILCLYGPPGVGKTSFALNLATNAAYHGASVAFFSLEMSSVQLVNRLIASETELGSEKIRNGKLSEEEWQQLHSKIKALIKAPIYVDDTPALSIFELRAKCRRLQQRYGIKVLIIDYLQLMTAGADMRGNREQEVSMISRQLKIIAKELNIPVIALSQLNRGVEQRTGDAKKPMLSDLRESGAIEQDADMVLFVHRPEYYHIYQDEKGNDLHGMAQIIIAKHRKGSVGDVLLNFRGEFTRFQDPQDAAAAPVEEGGEIVGSRMNGGGQDGSPLPPPPAENLPF